MYIDPWKLGSDRDEIDFKQVEKYKEKYIGEIDDTAYSKMMEMANKMDKPVLEYDDSEMDKFNTRFLLLDSNIPVKIRLDSDTGNLIGLYITVEENIPDNPEKILGLIRALIKTAQNHGCSHPDPSYYNNNNKNEIHIHFLART